MKALLINPESRSIEPVEVADHAAIARLIGYDTIESDAVGAQGDRLFFDEECFLRGSSGRFQVDKVVPVSGKAVLAGTAGDGTTLADVVTTAADLESRTRYL